MFCTHCGSMIDDNVKFCPNCGGKILPPLGDDIATPEAPVVENPFEKATLTKAPSMEDSFTTDAGSSASPFTTSNTYQSNTYNTDSYSAYGAAGAAAGASSTNNNQSSTYQSYNQAPKYKGTAPIASRNIVLCILFSIITCGIYGIYWQIVMVNDLNTATEEPNETSGGMVFLFSLITCGIYALYWMYKAGTRLDNLKESLGRGRDSRGIVYLILTIFGFGIIAYCLIQNELNKLADGTY